MIRHLNGKIACISGASRGIGRAIALSLAEQGARCVLSARDSEKLDHAVRDIKGLGGEAASVALDLQIPTAPGLLIDFALSRFGRIDVIVNCAGNTKRGEFLELTDDDWSAGFELKFFGAVRLTRAAWPHLKSAQGSLLNIAGTGGRTPGATFAVGGSVNAALLSFTKAMAEIGVTDGVQVNAINPGSVRTDRLAQRLQNLALKQGVDEETAERNFIEAEKVTGIGEPADIANLAAFIVGPHGRFLHGALIDMDGGATKTI